MASSGLNRESLLALFGDVAEATTASEFARGSSQRFVRSQDHLSFLSNGATGRQLSATEALETFGEERLAQILDFGVAVLPTSPDEPATTLRNQRLNLGLTNQDLEILAHRANLSPDDVLDCEDPRTRSDIRSLERVARLLGLDDRQLSIAAGAGGDERLAVRLRTLGESGRGISPAAVISLAECAWAIKIEGLLAHGLGRAGDLSRFEPSGNYGTREYPAWQHGYYLAKEARRILGLADDEPIESMRAICDHLGIPLIQTRLPSHIAGATLDVGTHRGIVVNETGANRNPWVRRSTIGHELGHLLWDPPDRLESLKVDEYAEIDANYSDASSDRFVEARANAFSIQFLLPNDALLNVLDQNEDLSDGLRVAMETFGVSQTAASFHAWNALERDFPREALLDASSEPTDDWNARESFAIDYFPFEGTPISRRGRFAKIVVLAERAGLISPDTASEYLSAPSDEYANGSATILELMGD